MGPRTPLAHGHGGLDPGTEAMLLNRTEKECVAMKLVDLGQKEMERVRAREKCLV